MSLCLLVCKYSFSGFLLAFDLVYAKYFSKNISDFYVAKSIKMLFNFSFGVIPRKISSDLRLFVHLHVFSNTF